MSANQGVDLNTLLKGLQNAKLIPYGGSAPDGKFGGFLNALGYMKDFINGVSATPEGMPGIIGGLGSMADRHNVRSYNRLAQEQFSAQQAREIAKQNREQADRYMLGKQAGLHGYTGAADLPDAATLSNLQNMNFQNDPNGMGAFLKSGALNAVNGAAIPQYLVEKAAEQAQKVNQSQFTMNNLPTFLGQLAGQGISFAPDGTPTDAKTGTLDLSDSPAVKQLSASLAQSAPPQGVVMPGQAFQYPVVDYKEGLGFRKNEQDNTNTQYSNQTTRQHNERSDDLAKRELLDKIQKNYHKKWPPTGGSGSQNPYTVPNAQLENLNKLQGQSKKQLESMGLWDSKNNRPIALGAAPNQTVWDLNPFDGSMAPNFNAPNPAYQTEMAAYQQKQSAIDTYNNLLGVPSPSTRIQNVKQAGSNASASGFAAWKSGRMQK